MINWAAAAAIGFAAGLVVLGSIAYVALHPPEGYRRAMKYKALNEYAPPVQRKLTVIAVCWVVVFSFAAAGLAAWALPALSRSGH